MVKEVRTVSSSGGAKGVKAQAYNLVPARPLTELAVLFAKGARKYGDSNWIKGYQYSKSFAGLQRHISLFWSGEDYDLELGTLHAVNAAWHCVVIYTNHALHPEFDDRPSKLATPYEGELRRIVTDNAYPASSTDHEFTTRSEGEVAPRFDLIPGAVIARLAEFYGKPENQSLYSLNPTVTYLWSDYYNRFMEHVWAFWGGSDTDQNGNDRLIVALHYAFKLIDAYYAASEYDNRFTTEKNGAQPIGFDSAPDPK